MCTEGLNIPTEDSMIKNMKGLKVMQFAVRGDGVSSCPSPQFSRKWRQLAGAQGLFFFLLNKIKNHKKTINYKKDCTM